ncbi:MAG: peptide deformylase [Bacteroidetes bacterium]|nr:peptide deformylase [Bacteroidota bacterium]
MSKQFLVLLVPAILFIFGTNQCKKDKLADPPKALDTLALTELEKDSILNGDTNNVMRILTIDNYSDSLNLRVKSHQVRADKNDTVLYRLARRMYYTLISTGSGVGLAAPQVGINRDIIWVQRLDKTGKPFECYINPKIVLYSNKQIVFQGDGCLSIPNQSGKTNRFSSVAIEYDRLDGTHNTEIVEGYSGNNFTSVIFQHEIDHLNGILFFDRLSGKFNFLQAID